MKKIFFLLFAAVFIMIVISGCRKNIYGCVDPSATNYNPNANVGTNTCTYISGCTDPTASNYNASATVSTNTCTYTGNVMFWFPVNHGTGTVNINNQSAQISGYVTGGTPNCGNSVSANFTLPAGTYAYTASSTDGSQWNGNATVLANQCQLYQLSSNTSTNTGNVTFWFSVNHGACTVNINGQSAQLTGYVTGGTPNCGNSVSANFTMPAGTYAYTASSTDGSQWSGNATVPANQCQLYHLN